MQEDVKNNAPPVANGKEKLPASQVLRPETTASGTPPAAEQAASPQGEAKSAEKEKTTMARKTKKNPRRKAARKAARRSGARTKPAKFDLKAKFTVAKDAENPRRPGSGKAKAYEKLRGLSGSTVEELQKKGMMSVLRSAMRHKFGRVA